MINKCKRQKVNTKENSHANNLAKSGQHRNQTGTIKYIIANDIQDKLA